MSEQQVLKKEEAVVLLSGSVGLRSRSEPVEGRGRMRRRPLEVKISKKAGRAMCDYGMIAAGDRILVAVSGGKDSLTLFKILSDRRSFVPVDYELVPIHVDLGHACMNRAVLKSFFERQGAPLHVRGLSLLRGAKNGAAGCFWCSWNRRKVLFAAAKEFKCNKLALGHHKDDIVETILMNIFFEGQISAMVPCQPLFGGELTIIRPLAYVKEAEIKAFVLQNGLPATRCSCPGGRHSKRAAVKQLLSHLEETSTNVKTNIFKSLQRIKKDYLL